MSTPRPEPSLAAGDAEVMPFADASSWDRWLSENHRVVRGIWLQLAKKASGIPTVTYDEALEVALCHGWIDGQRRGYDEDYFLQRFTPRRARSLWSKRNVAKVSRLIDLGRMRTSGLADIEAARRDGRWQAAYDSPKDMVVPEDFVQALEHNAKARSFFDGLGKSERFLVGWRLQTAKTPEARARRLESMIEQLERNESLARTR